MALAVGAAMNFSLKSWPQPDGKWGSLLEDGSSWSGMIGNLAEKRADLTLTPLTMTPERKEAVDFAHPAHQGRVSAKYILFVCRSTVKRNYNFRKSDKIMSKCGYLLYKFYMYTFFSYPGADHPDSP